MWQPKKTYPGIKQELISTRPHANILLSLKKKLKGLTQITMKENKYAHRKAHNLGMYSCSAKAAEAQT